tara:strand:- start:442 stop:1617 length:1176 start_codon:yes stop_codon:yes gene_type:complete
MNKFCNSESLRKIRRELHQNPEIGFEENFTANRVRTFLEDNNIRYVSGLGKTGIVAWVTGQKNDSGNSVALRADMDALPIEEKSGVTYSSVNKGKMHACGHDGHVTMLLGAALFLIKNNNFSGTVYFIFQPAEEGLGGSKAMIKDGLFEKFSINEIYSIHNWPDLPVGKFGLMDGPIMASGDRIDIVIHGKGGHGGLSPHNCIDPIRIASELINKAHTIVGREINPLSPAVISICSINGGDINGFAVIPNTVKMSGTTRALDKVTQASIHCALRNLCESIEKYYGTSIELKIENKFSITFNEKSATKKALKVICENFGSESIQENHHPSMAGEDFSFMLDEVPGAYIHVGSGDDNHKHGLHSPYYDFNDEIIPTGVTLLSQLAIKSLETQV